MPAALPAEILAALARGATVLTANQRAARTLRRVYDDHMRASTRWSPPEIYALDTWLTTLWHRLLVDGSETALLLNRTQEHALWRTILGADRGVPTLRSLDALAQMAARAWHLLHLHNGFPRLRGSALSTDAQAFGRWSQAFTRTCTQNSYLTQAQLAAALEAALTRGDLPILNPGLTLVDFDLLSPATNHFLKFIERAGYPVEHLTTFTPTTSAALYPALDDASELRAAAAWAGDYLSRNPGAIIAIVVPNLAGRRATLQRTLAAVLPVHLPYEFSLGTSLAETALAATALDLLRWSLQALSLESISSLLLSPFFIAPAEALTAAEFDAYDLRATSLLRPELTPTALLDLLRASSRLTHLPGLKASLRNLRNSAAGHHLPDATIQSHSYWAAAFRDLLDAAGWSRDAGSDSTTYQMRRRWESALDELATLDFDGTRIPPAAALSALTRIVRQTVFAPESRHAPIQIVGPLELGGVPFDALWFVSADDSSWPSPAATNPLLPWQLQRDLLMPGASPAHDAAVAQTLTDRIANSAMEVVFSYALQAEDAERRPSPLLASLNLTPLPHEEPSPTLDPLPLESYADDEPLPPLPPGPISGGATILELQAACPFRAFAERRLFSTAPESRQPGLDARDRGSLLHRIMQAFWARVESQANLRALTSTAREAILDDCIDRELHRHSRHAETPWDTAYLDVQRRRLHSLLTPWLDFELTRPPFTVEQQETELREARIGPLTLNLRVDRIDLTAAGSLVLDYKTGDAAPSEWLGDRPDAPQLPLYAVLAPLEELAGVAFASLRPGEDKSFRGFADDLRAIAKPTLNPSRVPLPDQREDWYRILTNLATAFAEGDTLVDPKCYPKTCQYCSQRTLCRLDPAALQDFSEEDDPTYAEAAHD